MTTIQTIIAVLWSIRIIGNTTSLIHLWWVKEYRWDRMFIHLRTPQGRRIYWLPWKRPRLSPKTIGLFVTSMSLFIGWMILSPLSVLWSLAVFDFLSVPLSFVLVYGINIPVFWYQHYTIRAATKKLRNHRPMTVIGITGSFGKTSTKEYLATILSTYKKTVKTEKSKNSPIGIAEVVLSKLQPDHELFVVEMGAYKPGEIERMAQLVRPNIGIITAINAQHQDLFGSIETTMKAKYELLKNVTGQKIALCNYDNEKVRVMGQWAKKDGLSVYWYGVSASIPNDNRSFVASDIVPSTRGVTFTCSFAGSTAVVRAALLGAHQANTLTGAIAAATLAGMPFAKAAKAACAVTGVPGVLQPLKGINGYTLIDDTFNNNPDAAKAAIDVLSLSKEKRILVFQPMIELGRYAESAHREVGAYAARVCDAIVLTNANWSDQFLLGVRSVSQTVPVFVGTSNEAISFIKSHAPKHTSLLFKGKEAHALISPFAV